MKILGISAYHPDASAALVIDGAVVAAIDEERLNRIKHSPGFPERAIRYCLEAAGLGIGALDRIAVANDLRANLARKAAFAARAFPLKSWPGYIADYLDQRIRRPMGVAEDLSERIGGDAAAIRPKLRRVEHHAAHAASAFFLSPFERSAILTLDGSGDFVTAAMSLGQGSMLKRLHQLYWPNSLGMLYFAVTQHLGFHELGAEGKVMALASYGRARYMDEFKRIVRPSKDGLFMDMSYFTFHLPVLIDNWGDPTTSSFFVYRDWLSPKFHELLGPPRAPGSEITEQHKDIAASLQKALEEAVFHLLGILHARAGSVELCLAGGVALNCVMNGKVSGNTPFSHVFVQPNSGDGGLSLGSALYVHHKETAWSVRRPFKSASLGTSFTSDEVRAALDRAGLEYERHEDVAPIVARRIAQGRVVGWFQGRMEFGPRALGNRSILADPRDSHMRDFINRKVKHREAFRPFAPSVLEEEARRFFNLNGSDSPFMLLAVGLRPEAARLVPAIAHVDNTARVQTVDRSSNPVYRRLIEEFRAITGIPMLLNTSFNLRGEPVVSSPEEAIRSFLASRIDVLAIEDCIVEKK